MPNDKPVTTSARAAKAIKTLRIKQRLTQGYVAKRMLLPRTAITNLENCKRQITLEDFENLARIFCVSPTWLARTIWHDHD